MDYEAKGRIGTGTVAQPEQRTPTDIERVANAIGEIRSVSHEIRNKAFKLHLPETCKDIDKAAKEEQVSDIGPAMVKGLYDILDILQQSLEALGEFV